LTLKNGAKVHYVEANKDAKKTIIVVHGITGTHYSMFQMTGVWAERGDHVITFDLPGHGKSDRIAIGDFTHLADWLDECISTLYPKGNFVLMGNSFGSSVCAAYAYTYGLRDSSGLVLGAPIPDVHKVIRFLEKISTRLPDKLISVVYYQNRLIEMIRIWALLSTLRSKQLRSRVRESLRSEAKLVQHSYAFRQLMPYNYKYNPFARTIDDLLRQKTRVVYGKKDKIAGKSVGKAMRQWIGDDYVIEVKSSGHLVHVEAVPELTDAVDELMNGNPRK
jgi:pimeloyl-ACP methyl ester carboxylesterase